MNAYELQILESTIHVWRKESDELRAKAEREDCLGWTLLARVKYGEAIGYKDCAEVLAMVLSVIKARESVVADPKAVARRIGYISRLASKRGKGPRVKCSRKKK